MANVNPKETEYFIAFYTEHCPTGTLDCVRVRLDMIRQSDMSQPMDIGLADHPLYLQLQEYVKANPR